jgi:uncharacterized protein with WD repeat
MLFFNKKTKKRKIVLKSGLFDQGYYLTTNPDVKNYHSDPLQHYLLCGEKEGRKPNPLFDPVWYLNANTDVKIKELSPLLHYIQSGENEGRKPSPLFDPVWYLQKNPTPKRNGWP